MGKKDKNGKIRNQNNQNIAVLINPFSIESGYLLTDLSLEESIGGELPLGSASFLISTKSRDSEDINKILDSKTGEIIIEEKKDQGRTIKTKIFIVKRNLYGNTLNINFICSPDENFTTKLKSTTYKGIKNAIKGNYSGPLDLRTEPPSSFNKVDLYQFNETSHNFIVRLCYAFKNNIVFGFSWDGLIVKDIADPKQNFSGKEENIVTGDKLFQVSSQALDYDANLGDAIPEKSLESEYAVSYINKTEYGIASKDYYEMMINASYNSRILSSDLYSVVYLSGNMIPEFRLGDTVNYRNTGEEDLEIKLPMKKYYVYSNKFVLMGESSSKHKNKRTLGFTWETKLIGLEKQDSQKTKTEEDKEEKK